jgi:hypothetical protein
MKRGGARTANICMEQMEAISALKALKSHEVRWGWIRDHTWHAENERRQSVGATASPWRLRAGNQRGRNAEAALFFPFPPAGRGRSYRQIRGG